MSLVQIHIEGTADEVRAEMSKLLGSTSPVVAETVSLKKTKVEPKPEPKVEPKTEVKEEPKTESASEGAVAFVQVADTIKKVMSSAKGGKPAIIELLGKFNVKKGSELTEAQYAPFVDAAKAYLE